MGYKVKKIYVWTGDITAMRGPCDEGFHVPSKDDANKLRTMYQSIVPSGSRDTSTQLLAPSLRKYFYAGSSSSGNPYPNNFIVFSNVFSSSYSHSYWTSTNYDIGLAYTMRVSVNDILTIDNGQDYKGKGYPIRPFKDTVVEPDSNWTVLYQGTGTAGIYHNSTLGLISISSDGSDWITIADKDLGATSVNGSGNLYQRGNNYGFTYSAGTYNSGFGTTLVNASNYGPGNYYSNSQPTFAKTTSSEWGYYWDSSNNDNLRGGETGPMKEHQVYPKPPRTFTISWTETSNPAQFNPTYSDDAAGLTPGSTEFDKFFGYYGCRLSNTGAETATVNQSSPGTLDITQLGTLTSGDNVMIAFPRLGIKMSKSGSVVTLSITNNPEADGFQYYAHTKGSDVKNNLYLGAYKMSNGYKSLSGVAPLVNQTRATFRSGIKNVYDSSAGTNRYSQITIYARWFINALYMMKYGNPNSQSVIGKGYTGGSAKVNTGGTDSQTSASYGTSSGTVQVKLFGLEDWRGNVCEWIDGCYINSSTQLTVDKTNNVFQDSDYSTNLGAVSSGWLAGIDGSNDGMFRNINTSGGSGTAYYTDNYSTYASRVLYTGGAWAGGDGAGAFNVNRSTNSGSGSDIGSRLMYL